VPAGVGRCGVFVDADPGLVAEAVDACGLTEVQFHGAETPERCADAPAPVVKAFRVGEEFDPREVEPYRGTILAGLLDAHVEGEHGGTGRRFAWEVAEGLPEWMPVIVAGGLDAANVTLALERFRPFGVDVSSGVEEWPGNKDRHRMNAFVYAVRAVESASRGACA
jgi:phosphoribosylanthranilate isomerase